MARTEDQQIAPAEAPLETAAGSRWRTMARAIFWTVMTVIGCTITLGTIVAGLYPRVSTLLECGSVSACYR